MQHFDEIKVLLHAFLWQILLLKSEDAAEESRPEKMLVAKDESLI